MLVSGGSTMSRRLAATVIVLTALVLANPVTAGPADDAEMTRQVSDQLRRSATVGHLGLAAKVRDGRVVLEGRALSLGQVREAEDIAGKVRGVLTLENRIRLDSRSASDATIASAVRRKFEDHPELADAGLDVKVDAGSVTLSGKVRDARLRFAAADAAAEVEGVVEVTDRIESPPKDDESIRKAATALLGRGSLVRVSGKIETSVKDGVVTLEGSVARLYDRKRSERLVLGINGVRAIENRLEVNPSRPDLVIPLD